jgi:hypothetical protein
MTSGSQRPTTVSEQGVPEMRNVTLIMSASVDGFVVGPAGHAGTLPEPAELKQWKLDRIRRPGTHFMGRVTYEEMVSPEASARRRDRRLGRRHLRPGPLASGPASSTST